MPVHVNCTYVDSYPCTTFLGDAKLKTKSFFRQVMWLFNAGVDAV